MDGGMVIHPRRPVPKLHWLRSLRTPHPERVTSHTVAGGDPLLQKVADDKGLSPTKYPDELRQRAVRMVFEVRAQTGGAPGAIARVADQLGLHREALRTWIRQAEIDGGQRPGVSTAEQRRIAELERENRELRRANEILKAASA
jgi:transposase